MVLLKSVAGGQWPVVGRNRPSGLLTWLKPCFYLFILFTVHCSLFTSLSFAEEKVYRIKIDGMHCKSCIYSVTKSLKKLKQIKDVEVKLEEGVAIVVLNDGKDVTAKELEEAVKDSGYKPDKVEVAPSK